MLANAYAVAKRNNEEVFLPPWEYQDIFKVNLPTTAAITYEIDFWEKGYTYSPVPALKNANLHGYFQSEKYFVDYAPAIKQMFQPNDAISAQIASRYGAILSEETVGIHVRRGDYLKFTDHHPVMDQEYYFRAIEAAPRPKYYVIVSNDIRWCKETFKGDKFIFVDSPQERPQGNQSTTFDLFLLSKCNHQIIANSSYSWWASYLNLNRDKVVIAPKIWYGPEKLKQGVDPKDLYLSSWIVI